MSKVRLLLALFALLVSACTTTKEIILVEEYKNVDFENLETVQFFDSLYESYSELRERYPSGIKHMSFQSSSDLKTILKRKEMMYLNYEVVKCDNRKDVLLFGPTFIEPSTYGQNETYIFHIGLPKDMDLAVSEQLKVMSPFHEGYEKPLENLCLSLGAGSMIGSSLETNLIPIK